MPLAWRSELESMLDAELCGGAVDDPFRPAVLRWAASSGRPADHGAVLSHLEGRTPRGRGSHRFRWQAPLGRFVDPDRLTAWRPAEAELATTSPSEHASRLWLPPILVEHLAWLEELAAGTDDWLARRARLIADEAAPTIEDVVAGAVPGSDAWADTFLLWSFSRTPRALAPVRGLVLALAARYAARANRTSGIVRGRTYPYFNEPMPSATASLATASAALGEGVQWVDKQLSYLRAERRPDGGWGDPRQPSDLVSTLAAARLLGSVDPSFDPASAIEPLQAIASRAGGHPAAIGPEWPWIAAELINYLDWAGQEFIERFRWPNVPPAQMDPRVNLPRFEGYLALGDLFGAVAALREEPVEVAFIDLANFGTWNTTHGMDRGDELLAFLCQELRTLPRSRAFRDGGDEFLVVGAPGARQLEDDLTALLACWPERSIRRFPGLGVAPLRAVISTEQARDLRVARGRQGEWIGPLKHDYEHPPDAGVIRRHVRDGGDSWKPSPDRLPGRVAR